MSKQIRTGIAGFGMSARLFHAPFIAADPRFTLAKVLQRTGDDAARLYPGTQVVRSFEELLTDDIDLVVLCTPNPLHFAQAEQALRAGKAVVCEKPVTATAGEARELVRLAQERGVLFTVYQNRRWDGDFLTVRRLVEDGTLGEVLEYRARFDRFVTGVSKKPWKAAGGEGVDVLYDLGIHLIDQACVLFGMPEEVYADLEKQRPESGGIDNFWITLYYGDKKAVLSAGEVIAMPGPHFEVHGRKGSYLKYGMDPQGRALSLGLIPGQPLPSGLGWGEEESAAWGTLALAGPDGITRQALPTLAGHYGAFYNGLYEALTAGAPLPVDPASCVDALRVLEAARKSAACGSRVRL